MERKKRSKGRGWESCYVKKIYGTFGVEMRAYGQKLVKFCTHTHTRLSYSSIDIIMVYSVPTGQVVPTSGQVVNSTSECSGVSTTDLYITGLETWRPF